MTITDQLVQWGMTAKFEDISNSNLIKLKMALLDSLGCMIGGSQTEVGQAIRSFITKNKCQGESIVPGIDLRVNPRDSAFINAALANALDYDDTYEEDGKALCHPGATLIATALAASSINPISGKDFLASLAVGYEVSARIGESVQPSPDIYVKVWGLNHFMVFGAAMIASRLLRLNHYAAQNAFGIAGVAANLPSAWKWNFHKRELPLSWQKDMVSWPAESGLRAALLAESGFKGCLDILDGDDGFWRMSASDQFDPTRIIGQLGYITHLENLAFKPYPCCRWIHSILEAFGKAYHESGISPEDIQSVDVYTLSELANHFAVVKPQYMIDAEFSVPYTIAMIARGIPIGPEWHTRMNRVNPQTFEIASRVNLIATSDIDRNYFENRRISAKVVLKDKNGSDWIEECQQARGGKQRPFSLEEHNDKIARLVDPVFDDQKKQLFIELISKFETIPDVSRELNGFLQL